jgi:toxin HigB-1
MRVRHADKDLERLEIDSMFYCGYSENTVSAFRKRMQLLRAMRDERDLYAFKSCRFEKLKGSRSHQHSIRLNDQMRLILEFEGRGPGKTMVVVGIEDYHS